jgi:hypothetical protein
MTKYFVTIAANVRAYATVEIEAANEDAAWQRAKDIAASENIWDEPEIEDVTFEPEYDTLDEFEPLEDLEVSED